MGALPLKLRLLASRYPAHYERFQWLAKQLRDGGCEATLIRTAEIEGITSSEIRAGFNEARAADYEELNRDLTALLRANKRKISDDLAASAEKLRARFAEVQKNRFFEAPAKHDTLVLWQKLERLSEPKLIAVPPARRSDFHGRTWLTRPRPEVDRVASAWLIKTFIDPKAKFIFAPAHAAFPDAVAYDMLDAEFTHSGDDCTFETLIKRFELKDKSLKEISEMVHQADLQDGKFAAAQAEGIHCVLRGLARLSGPMIKSCNMGLSVSTLFMRR